MGVLGIAVMVAGATLVLLSFATLAWYGGSRGPDSVGNIGFSDLHHLMNSFDAPATSRAYFAWLGWVLLISLIIVGFAANLPTAAADALRVLGLMLGLGGSAVTYYALSVYFDAIKRRGGSTGGVFENAHLGVWFAIIGFAVAGVGAAVGPMRAK